MQKRRAAAVLVTMLVMLAVVWQQEDLALYITKIKTTAVSGQDSEILANAAVGPLSVAELESTDELLRLIREEAEKRYEAPIDARIDRVWKAIPGYNGLKVNVEQTYAKAVQEQGVVWTRDTIPYVYEELTPKIQLEDLGAYPIYRGNSSKKMVSFMINVAWGNEHIAPMLQTLEDEQVKATFFLDGSWLKNNVDLAQKIKDAGHELSNHAYSHPDMSKMGRTAASDQIVKTQELLHEKLGVSNKWFAPPSGAFNQATILAAEAQGLKVVLWTIDTIDWRKPPASAIINKIHARLEPGALILMHPTTSSRDALKGMIKSAKEKGYAIGTVSQTLSAKRVQLERSGQ